MGRDRSFLLVCMATQLDWFFWGGSSAKRLVENKGGGGEAGMLVQMAVTIIYITFNPGYDLLLG